MCKQDLVNINLIARQVGYPTPYNQSSPDEVDYLIYTNIHDFFRNI